MRLFFEGYVPSLAQEVNSRTGEPRVYLMYAGGDDLFVVGGWSDLPHLAQRIRQDFGKFACSNPLVTISGGISLALDGKYPLYQVARAAGSAEALAKDAGRNALTFLGQPLPWDKEYAQVAARVAQLAQWVEQDGPLPRSFLMTLRAIDAQWRRWRKDESGLRARYQHRDKALYLGPWQWRLIYSLTRAVERSKNNDLKREVDALVQSILDGEIYTLGLSTRWAELLTRTRPPSDY